MTKMRVDVLDSVKEEVFWRNYFYRVSLIKQSAQLTALAAQQQQKDGEDKGASVSPEDVVLSGQIFILEMGEMMTNVNTITDIHHDIAYNLIML